MTPSEAGKLGGAKNKLSPLAVQKRLHAEAISRWVPTDCLNCGKPIPYEKRDCKFCSHSCAASFNNRGVQHNKAKKPPVNLDGNCLGCGKHVGAYQKYCTRKCKLDSEFQRKLEIVRVTGNVRSAWKTEGQIRSFLLKTLPLKCSICQGVEWMGQPLLLIMDHIDGNSENWKMDNLRLICSNCDAQTSTYKGRNFGQGRTFRAIAAAKTRSALRQSLT